MGRCSYFRLIGRLHQTISHKESAVAIALFVFILAKSFYLFNIRFDNNSFVFSTRSTMFHKMNAALHFKLQIVSKFKDTAQRLFVFCEAYFKPEIF